MPFNEPYSLMSKSMVWRNKTHRLPELSCYTVSVYFELCMKQWCITEQADICSSLPCTLNALPSDRVRRLSGTLPPSSLSHALPCSPCPLFSGPSLCYRLSDLILQTSEEFSSTKGSDKGQGIALQVLLH